VTLASSELQRTTQAVEAKAAAASALDRARAELEQAQARLSQMEAGVAKAEAATEQAKAKSRQLQVLIEKKTLKAPFRARMGIRSIHPGQYLAENTKVVDLQGIADTTYLDFAIPQDEAWRVKPGMIVPARSETLGTIALHVQAVDATVDRSTRNVRIRTIVDNAQEKLRPGTFVDVEVPMGEPSTRLLVPAVAVRRSSYGDHVFVSVPGEKPGELRAKQRFVKVGAGVGADLVIEDGLKEGERIATAGAFKLRDGALIIPTGQGPTGQGPTGQAAKVTEPAADAKPASEPK
jgi:membrane fusion protein (multidrug efflux system)